MIRLCVAAALVLALVGGLTEARADEITYRLESHPDGSASSPSYGLRLDEFDDLEDTANNTVWTFDFSDSRSAMYLTWDTTAGTFRIHGTTWGGLDTGSSYDVDNRGLFDIDFTYDTNITAASTSSDMEVKNTSMKGQAGSNTGTIEFTDKDSAGGAGLISEGYSLDLVDWSNGDGLFYRFLEDNHRLPSAYQNDGWFVGRGWMGARAAGTTDSYFHTNYQDWLFIGRPVPEPGTWALLACGLSCLAVSRGRRRRRRR